MDTSVPASNIALPRSTLSPLQQWRAWWAHSGAEQVAALDGMPIVQLLDHCVHSLERADPAAQHEMEFLLVLIERWLHRFEADIAAFPDAAVPVLQRQKAQLQATRSALSQLQQALQLLAGETCARSKCQRAPWLAWALRRRSASHRPRA